MGFHRCVAALLFLTTVCTASSADIYEDAFYDAGSKAYYRIHQTPATWFSAYTTCVKEGGQLAMINKDNKAFLQDYFLSGSAQRIFLGFDSWANGKWTTIQDKSLSDEGYQSWAAGEPNNAGGTQRCGTMYDDGNLDDDDCYHKNRFVCQINAFPGEYTYYEGSHSYYKIHVKPTTWLDAHSTCINEGAHLAIINNEDEANFFKRNYPSNTKSIFLGFSNWENNMWVTVNGQALSETGYEEWAPGEPNNGGGRQQCGTMYRSGKLDDDFCDRKLPFICEKKSDSRPSEDSTTAITTTTTEIWDLSTATSRTEGEHDSDSTTALTDIWDLSTTVTSQTIEEYDSDKFSRSNVEKGKVVKYTIHKKPRTWINAFATCVKDGGHLAIANEYNKAFFFSNFPSDTVRVFLGFNDFETGSWRTIRDQSLSDAGYENWREGEPNNAQENQRCGAMFKNGEFDDDDCLHKNPFFCKIDDSYPNYQDNQSTEGYIYYAATGMYYRFHKQPATWLTAYATCIQEGGTLAVINNQDEADFFIRNYPSNAESVLLGFNNWEANDTWVTVNGQQLSQAGYEEWAPGEPNRGGGKQRCGTMYRSGKLDDDFCDRKLPFICEKKSNFYPSEGITPSWYTEAGTITASYSEPESTTTFYENTARDTESTATLYNETESTATLYNETESTITLYNETESTATLYRSETETPVDNETVTNEIDVSGSPCVDSYGLCDLMRRHNMCAHKYYLKVCCATCAQASSVIVKDPSH